jgi:5-methylthioribose kinase
MQLLDVTNTIDYLRRTNRVAADEQVHVEEFSGGVSNIVLLVQRAQGQDFVIKQARERLRVEHEWRCSCERIFREIETLRICQQALVQPKRDDSDWNLSVPEILWEDRENFAFAMTAAPRRAQTWKDLLLAREVDVELADACGTLLGQLHSWGWLNPAVESQLSDVRFFEALRVEPFYRHILAAHPELSAEIERLISSLPYHRFTLVHGDYSPKNVLVWDRTIMLVDFEVGHFGDPAFDTGFFLAHLVLKTIWSSELRGDYAHLIQLFWDAYRRVLKAKIGAQAWLALEERTIFHLAGCLLSRIDGKSRIDYLDATQQAQVRELAKWLFVSPPESVAAVLRRVE